MDRYSIVFTAAGLTYLRQVLGTRPYDEVGVLIANIAQQQHEQDHPPAPPLPSAPDLVGQPLDHPEGSGPAPLPEGDPARQH